MNKPAFTVDRYQALETWARGRCPAPTGGWFTWYGRDVAPARDLAACPGLKPGDMVPSFYTRVEQAAFAKLRAAEARS